MAQKSKKATGTSEKPSEEATPAHNPVHNIDTAVSVEDSLKELENIVELLEKGDQSLEQSLEQFERGIKLSRECQQSLEAAEQKVKILKGENLEDFAQDEQDG